MLFNSYSFIFLFLPLTLWGYFSLAKYSRRLSALWLAAASLFFYGCWNPTFVVLILTSITVNYAFGWAIGHARLISLQHAKTLLIVAVVANLGMLAYFKYANFFIANANQLAGVELTVVDVILPLGISFFTFTQIAFLVDVYRGIAREYNFIHYVLFVTYFPHLIAGPVLHHKQMMPQFGHAANYRINLDNINVGLTIFVIGLAKKVLIADELALYSNPVFDGVAKGGEPMLFEAWIGALAYTLQLYFDFSGYSDMAIGLSRLFNVRLPLNFDSPYKATNIIEFWRRWHMTLSAFLRDYLYVPLGGSRKGAPRRYINLLTTMLLGGLWHGAGWTFVLWGGMHGAYLVINHGWRRLTGSNGDASGWRAAVGIGLTFVAVVVAWVPFRAIDMDTALRMWRGMFGMNGISWPENAQNLLAAHVGQSGVFDGLTALSGVKPDHALLALFVGLTITWVLPNTQQWMRHYAPSWDSEAFKGTRAADLPPGTLRGVWRPTPGWAIATGLLFCACLMSLNKYSQFLYFQF